MLHILESATKHDTYQLNLAVVQLPLHVSFRVDENEQYLTEVFTGTELGQKSME